ncbi:MAG TPA: ArsR family transcriptional regulator [Methanoculleus sp.]|nr:ArsR family transcriptional regulator [Methanoculleus sp.]
MDCERIVCLPPSARAVFSLLGDGSPRTFKDMTREADIAPRTVRYALKRLKESDLIVEKFNFRDARQVIYQRKDAARIDEERTAAV